MRLITNAVEVEARLTELQLRRGWLEHSVRVGDAGASSSTALHPPNDGGVRRYADTVAGLRAQALPHGWEMSNAKNYCTVFNRRSKTAVAVMAGDAMTGLAFGTPKSLSPRGPITIDRIARNKGQLSMFPKIKAPSEIVEEDCSTWALIQYGTDEGVQFELSLPKAMNASGYVTDYEERILFGRIDPQAQVLPVGSQPNGDPDVDFVVIAR